MTVNRTLWSAEEIAMLKKLAAEGLTSRQIAKHIKRSDASIRSRAVLHEIPLGPRGRPSGVLADPTRGDRLAAEAGSRALLKAQIRAGQVFVTRRAA